MALVEVVVSMPQAHNEIVHTLFVCQHSIVEIIIDMIIPAVVVDTVSISTFFLLCEYLMRAYTD